jgi:hypothetical protein
MLLVEMWCILWAGDLCIIRAVATSPLPSYWTKRSISLSKPASVHSPGPSDYQGFSELGGPWDADWGRRRPLFFPVPAGATESVLPPELELRHHLFLRWDRELVIVEIVYSYVVSTFSEISVKIIQKYLPSITLAQFWWIVAFSFIKFCIWWFSGNILLRYLWTPPEVLWLLGIILLILREG